MEPERTPGDIHFVLFGFPVRIHPFFWIMAVLLGLNVGNPIKLLLWIAAVVVGILIHELGHAVVMRRYGYSPSIVLHGFGGLAIPNGGRAFGSRRPSPWGEILISAAGPLAGFALAGIIVGVLMAAGYDVGRSHTIPILPELREPVGSEALTTFIKYLLWISVFWGIVNLLPVLPLDGGHIAQQLFMKLDPWDGHRKALILSMLTAIIVALAALLRFQEFWIALLFGYLAYNSMAMLSAGDRGRW